MTSYSNTLIDAFVVTGSVAGAFGDVDRFNIVHTASEWFASRNRNQKLENRIRPEAWQASRRTEYMSNE
jgi:hypothetical protein